MFQTSKRGDLSYVGHLRAYQDITEDSNIDLGASYSRGHNASGIVNDVDFGRTHDPPRFWDLAVGDPALI